jgi:hypothetical protein
MEVMTAIVVLGVLALVAAIVAWLTWHRGADERQSVQHHQHTLETLRHVADRHPPAAWPSPSRRRSVSKIGPTTPPASAARGATRRQRGGAPQQSGKGAPSVKRSTPPRGGAAASSARPVGVEGVAAPPRPVAPSPSGKESAKLDAGRRQTVAFAHDATDAPSRRSPVTSAAQRMGARLPGAAERARREGRARVRRTRLVVAAAVIVIGGAVGAALAFGGSHPPSHATAKVTPPSRPITAAGHGLPTTTVLTGDLLPSAPTAFSAHYVAPATAYTVVINASATCWVMATDPSSGHVVWTGTVAPGASHSLSVSGGLVVQVGAPTDVSVTMDGRPVELPTGFRSPFTLTFGVTS